MTRTPSFLTEADTHVERPRKQASAFGLQSRFQRVLHWGDFTLLAIASTHNVNLLIIPAIASGGSTVLLLWLIAIPAFLIPQFTLVRTLVAECPEEVGFARWCETESGSWPSSAAGVEGSRIGMSCLGTDSWNIKRLALHAKPFYAFRCPE